MLYACVCPQLKISSITKKHTFWFPIMCVCVCACSCTCKVICLFVLPFWGCPVCIWTGTSKQFAIICCDRLTVECVVSMVFHGMWFVLEIMQKVATQLIGPLSTFIHFVTVVSHLHKHTNSISIFYLQLNSNMMILFSVLLDTHIREVICFS